MRKKHDKAEGTRPLQVELLLRSGKTETNRKHHLTAKISKLESIFSNLEEGFQKLLEEGFELRLTDDLSEIQTQGV